MGNVPNVTLSVPYGCIIAALRTIQAVGCEATAPYPPDNLTIPDLTNYCN